MKIIPLSSDYHQKVFDLIKIFSDQYVMLPKSLDEIINLADSFRILVNDKDEVIACAMLDQFTDELAEVKSLAVDKAYQGQGFGRLLVEDCEAAACAKGIKKLFALTFEEKFFNKLGFKTVSMESLPEKVYRECVRCHYFNNCKEIAVVKYL
jgi:amino-acid N-acetyltransferase